MHNSVLPRLPQEFQTPVLLIDTHKYGGFVHIQSGCWASDRLKNLARKLFYELQILLLFIVHCTFIELEMLRWPKFLPIPCSDSAMGGRYSSLEEAFSASSAPVFEMLLSAEFFLSCDGRARAHHRILSVAARGRGPERGPQEAVKAAGKLIFSSLQYVKQAPESLFCGVPDLDAHTAVNCAMNRVEWKENIPSTHC